MPVLFEIIFYETIKALSIRTPGIYSGEKSSVIEVKRFLSRNLFNKTNILCSSFEMTDSFRINLSSAKKEN